MPRSLIPVPRPRAEPAPLRTHLALAAEQAGGTVWCGPAALALATGLSYGSANALLRRIAPGWYPPEGAIVTAYWRDLIEALDRLSVPHMPVPLPDRPVSLQRLVRTGLPRGWYLLRVTDHFLLLRSHGFGVATLHDNRHAGVLVGPRTHGRRHVTHAVRLPEGLPERWG